MFLNSVDVFNDTKGVYWHSSLRNTVLNVEFKNLKQTREERMVLVLQLVCQPVRHP